MYKQISKLESLYGYFYIEGKIYTNRKEIERLQELSIIGEVLWESNEKDIYHYYINDDVIVFNLESLEEKYIYDRTFIYDRRRKTLIFKGEIELLLYASQCYENNILYDINDDNRIILFNILKGEIIYEEKKEIKGIINSIVKEFIIAHSNIYIYVYIKNDFSLLWQQNIQDFFPGEEELSILEIYSYKDTFIIIARVGIVCLSQKDGSLIWKCDHYARTMEIVGHYGYVCTSLSFYRVDLDTGEKYGYGRKYDRLPDFEYNGKNHWPSGHRVVYHKGLLWYIVYSSGESFIIAIDPETANYQWIHKVETYEKVMDIKFYDDKMFVTDTGYNLFIYEEE